MAERINYGKLVDIQEPPDLIEIQQRSYREFLQPDVDPCKRKPVGLQGVFKEVFPIQSYDGRFELDFIKYELGNPKRTPVECLYEGETYSAPLTVTFRLKGGEEVCEEDVYMGEIPMMTESGSFVVNGAERVVVSQLHRSPGISFESEPHSSGHVYSFRIIPDHGSWVEVHIDSAGLIHIYLDRMHRRRKFLAVMFLRAIGFSSNDEILRMFYPFESVSLESPPPEERLPMLALREDAVDAESQSVLARRYELLSKNMLKQMRAARIAKVDVIDISWDKGVILKNVCEDKTHNTEEALKEIFVKLRPGDPPTTANARQMLKNLFFDPKRFDLGRVGRYKINQKFNLAPDKDNRALDNEDIVEALKYLVQLSLGNGKTDDIDHLGGRRVKTVGELVANQCRIGLARTQKTLRDKLVFLDAEREPIKPQNLINPKSLSASVNDFFARSQLSQFMDQTNPLSELTHKRRLSALGPGGLSRERAGFDVRDVHTSHYGRICPVETPEGPNIGLISSLSFYARLNEYGFIETPYVKVENCKVTDKVEYLPADKEENFVIAQANTPLDANRKIKSDMVSVRYKGDFLHMPKESVQYMDLSPKQVVSVAAGLTPFLEHDDANRALMGANMMRQAVPLLASEAPHVATGLEKKVAEDSRVMVRAAAAGKVAYVSGTKIIVTKDGAMPRKGAKEKDAQIYTLRKFMRSNAGTCINQKPFVRVGQRVAKGDVLADGPCTAGGELALGRNVLVAFLPWYGYNFEDAIVISEKLVADDKFTSIHIEKFEISARDTKLGPEEITRDIPNVGPEALRNLGEDGVIRIGAEVKPGDILVGKVTPKSETELSPEERLLRAIFGDKAADVTDNSLRVPSGTYGIVMDVKISSQKKPAREKITERERRQREKAIEESYKQKRGELTEKLTEALSNILLGEKIPLDIVNAETGEKIIPAGQKITKTLLHKLALCSEHIEIDPSPIQVTINKIINDYNARFAELEEIRDRELEQVSKSDDFEEGVIKQVKVYIASKKRLEEGDKMAGRHGNKGVVARIVKEEDMPFLPDGTPVEIVLNPLGVPSRMNVGQVLETHLGWVCSILGMQVTTPIFDGISEAKIRELLVKAGLPESGKVTVFNGRTGEPFAQPVAVGMIYMMKLHHLVSEKVHARAVGPYSLVTQQPLGGKAQNGGQRFGEMEVWALEAYSAAYLLQEMLTVKSDDVSGRTRIYEAIVKGDNVLDAGTPESFNVLIKELQSLGLDIKLKETKKGDII